MDKKARTAWIFSIISAVFFALSAVLSLITTIETVNSINSFYDKADYCSEEYFYDHAELKKCFYTYEDFRYEYYFDDDHYTDYDDYKNSAKKYGKHADYLKQSLPFYIIFTASFLASAVGAFISRKKSFPLPLLIAQILSWVASLLFLLTFASIFYVYIPSFYLTIFSVLGFVYITYCVLVSLDKIKRKSVLAKLFAIPLILNSVTIGYILNFLNDESNPFSIFSSIEIVLLVHAFIFYYIGVYVRHSTYKKRPKSIPPVAAPQPVAYSVPVTPVVPVAPVPQPAQQQNKADEIKQYKDLLDSGAITPEEFEAKKKQLLGL
ncbi:MAG: SHOCT domain-containing protein [Clostridia bacterium]|nr:SHOCT domain-containing protein [Clostridia bacterium]